MLKLDVDIFYALVFIFQVKQAVKDREHVKQTQKLPGTVFSIRMLL